MGFTETYPHSTGSTHPRKDVSSQSLQTQPLPLQASPQPFPNVQARQITSDPLQELRSEIEGLKTQLETLAAEVDIIKSQSMMIIRQSVLSVSDRLYVRAGFNLILPRAATFTFQTDTGLGAFLGLGYYLNRYHVFQLTLDWDIYLSTSLIYRFELFTRNGGMRFGPIVGIKQRLGNIDPFDNFLFQPDSLKRTFPILGAGAGFPMGGSTVIQADVYLMFNGQSFFVVNAGLHFFL